MNRSSRASRFFDRLAGAVTRLAGRPTAFGLAAASILAWAASGPVFHYSETWQLVVNTSTTIVTFLMVFVIQHSQNKDSAALHLKLNELLASQATASNRLIAVEGLDEEELRVLAKYYEKLAKLSQQAEQLRDSHSEGGAKTAHRRKHHHRASIKPEAREASSDSPSDP